jgi:uncharacterized membrane protein
MTIKDTFQTNRISNFLHKLFEFGVGLKLVNGIWETVVGAAALLLSKPVLEKTFYYATRSELLEDPHDFFINLLANGLQGLSDNTRVFAALYILFHGLLNIFLAIQLFRNRLWAYKVSIGFMSLFIIYQLYRIGLHGSIILSAVTVFDIFFVILAWREYKYRKIINS